MFNVTLVWQGRKLSLRMPRVPLRGEIVTIDDSKGVDAMFQVRTVRTNIRHVGDADGEPVYEFAYLVSGGST